MVFQYLRGQKEALLEVEIRICASRFRDFLFVVLDDLKLLKIVQF